MNLADVYLVGENLEPASQAELDRAASSLAVRLPTRYVEYVRRFGRGEINGFLRVNMPSEMVEMTAVYQDSIRQFYECDGGVAAISKPELERSLLWGSSVTGDSFAFDPIGQRYYWVQREMEAASDIGATLEEAIDWMFGSGNLERLPAFYYFESWKNRSRILGTGHEAAANVQQLKDSLLKLKLHDRFTEHEEEDWVSFTLFVHDFFGKVECSQGRESVPPDNPSTMMLHTEGRHYWLPESASAATHEIMATLRDDPYADVDWTRMFAGQKSSADPQETLQPVEWVPRSECLIVFDSDRYTDTLQIILLILRTLEDLGVECSAPNKWE